MSVTFSIPGQTDCYVDCEGSELDATCPACLSRSYEINVSNANAIALLLWLGFSPSADLCGKLPVGELRARAYRRLWPEARNADPGVPEQIIQRAGAATLIDLGRREGYLPQKAEAFVGLCDRALALGATEIHYA